MGKLDAITRTTSLLSGEATFFLGELGVHFLSFFAQPYHAPPAKKDKNTPKGPWCPLGLLTFG